MKTFRYLRPLEIVNWEPKPKKKGGICFLFEITDHLSFNYSICPQNAFFSKEKAKKECKNKPFIETPFLNLHMVFTTQLLQLISNKKEFEKLVNEISRIELHNAELTKQLSLEAFKVSVKVDKLF